MVMQDSHGAPVLAAAPLSPVRLGLRMWDLV